MASVRDHTPVCCEDWRPGSLATPKNKMFWADCLRRKTSRSIFHQTNSRVKRMESLSSLPSTEPSRIFPRQPQLKTASSRDVNHSSSISERLVNLASIPKFTSVEDFVISVVICDRNLISNPFHCALPRRQGKCPGAPFCVTIRVEWKLRNYQVLMTQGSRLDSQLRERRGGALQLVMLGQCLLRRRRRGFTRTGDWQWRLWLSKQKHTSLTDYLPNSIFTDTLFCKTNHNSAHSEDTSALSESAILLLVSESVKPNNCELPQTLPCNSSVGGPNLRTILLVV